MQRRLLLFVLVAVAAFVLAFWIGNRERQDPVGPAVTVDAPPAQTIGPEAASTSSRSSAITPDAARSDPRAVPLATWTGFRVRVVAAETRAPLAGIRVHTRAKGAERRRAREVEGTHARAGEAALTDALGLVELEAAPDIVWTVRALPDEAIAASQTLEVAAPLVNGEVREIELALTTQDDLFVHLRVVDRETSAPIPGARVGHVTRMKGFRELEADGEQRTDADGRARISGKSWKQPVASLIAVGYEQACIALSRGHESPDRALEVALSASASARITVLDTNGAPIANVRATLSTELFRFGRPDGMELIQAGWVDLAFFSATTDANGVALVVDLPPRMPLEGVLHRRREELYRAAAPLTLAPGEMREIAWRLGETCAIHGVALESSGAPAAKLSICLEAARPGPFPYFAPISSDPRRFATTDDDGRFVFEGVSPGTWLVGPAPAKHAAVKQVQPDDAAARGQKIEIGAGVARVDVELHVQRGLSIRGRVLDPTGAPAARATLTARPDVGNAWYQEDVGDPAGEFVIGPLEAGAYELRADSRGEHVRSEPVRARAGDVDVVLRLREGCKARGIVVDARTGAPTRAEVLVRSANGVEGLTILTTLDDGELEVGGLAPGAYDFAAHTSDGRVGFFAGYAVASASVGDPFRIEVRPGASVRVRYEGPWKTAGICVLAGDVALACDGIELGTESTYAVTAGSVVVRITNYADRKEHDLPVTLSVGETRDVVFDGRWK